MTDQPSPYSQATIEVDIAHRDARIRELEAALAAAKAERDSLRALADLHRWNAETSTSLAGSVTDRWGAALDEIKALKAERDELREAGRAVVKRSSEAPFHWCDRCEEMATRVTNFGISRCDGCTPPMGASMEDLDYAPAWRRLVALNKETS